MRDIDLGYGVVMDAWDPMGCADTDGVWCADGETWAVADIATVALRDCELRYDRVTVAEAVSNGMEEYVVDIVGDAGDGEGGTLG